MVLFGLLHQRSAREGTEPPPTPVSQSKWSSFKSKLSGRREQPTNEPKTSINGRVSSNTTSDEAHRRQPSFSRQTSSPDLQLTSPHLPPMEPRHSMVRPANIERMHLLTTITSPPLQDGISLGSKAESSGSSRPVTPSSEASSSLSKNNYMFFAPLRASMIDETGSVENESPPLESQEDDGADPVVESSLPQAPIVPLDPAAAEAPVSLVEAIERSSTPEFEPACALECFIASSPYGGDDISACLRGGSAARNRRTGFRREDTPATTESDQPAKNPLVLEDVDTRNVTDLIVNDLQLANTGLNKSASVEFQPSSTVAPVVTSLTQETSSRASQLSTFRPAARAYNRRQVVDRTKNRSASSEAGPSLTVAPLLPPTSSHRMAIVAPRLTPIRELVSEDYPESLSPSSSSRGNDEENNGPFQSQDFADRTFAAAKSRSSTVTGPTNNRDRRITTEANTSAGGEDVSSPTAAPIGYTPLLHRHSAQAPGFITFSANGSAGNNGQTVDGNRNESAGPSLADAPITSIPLSPLKPRKVVRSAAPSVWSRAPQHARKIKSRVTSKLRQWGNGASNVLRVRRRADSGATGGGQVLRNGHHVAQDTKKWEVDPWQGYVPGSESSLQIDVNYDLADPWPVPTKPRVDLD